MKQGFSFFPTILLDQKAISSDGPVSSDFGHMGRTQKYPKTSKVPHLDYVK